MADTESKTGIMNKLDYLDNTKQLIRTALREKGQDIPAHIPFRSYAQIINDLQIGIDTSDADATEYDIIAPHTAYVNDRKLTGRIPKIDTTFSFDNIEIIQTNSSVSSLIKDYTMTDNRIFHKEYLDGIDLQGKDFLIYMRPNNNESQAIIFTWNNTEDLTFTLSNNTMILSSPHLTVYTDLFLNGTPSITEDQYSGIYFGNDSYYCTKDIYTNNNIVFNQCELLSYEYLTINQSFDQTKAILSSANNQINIEQTNLARIFGLTPNVLKKGVTIMGITGTYEGEIPSSEVNQINNNLEEVLGINE